MLLVKKLNKSGRDLSVHDDHDKQEFIILRIKEGNKAILHRFTAASAFGRYSAVNEDKIGGTMSMDIAFPRNERNWFEKLPKDIIIVPKIESPDGISNISEIVQVIPSKEKVLMLDHDDLFSSIIRKNEDKNNFQKYVKKLIDFCEKENISLLRTVGVMFSDDEKRTTQYEK